MLRFDPTTPVGKPLLSVDFTRLLPSGVTVSGASVTIEVNPLSDATDATPSARLSGSPSILTNTTIAQWFETGVENVDYVLTFIATYSDGQIEPVEVEMPVRKYI